VKSYHSIDLKVILYLTCVNSYFQLGIRYTERSEQSIRNISCSFEKKKIMLGLLVHKVWEFILVGCGLFYLSAICCYYCEFMICCLFYLWLGCIYYFVNLVCVHVIL